MRISKDIAKRYILHLIKEDDGHSVQKAVDTLSIARSSVYNYRKELLDDGLIKKNDDGKYVLVTSNHIYRYENKNLSEDKIFKNDIFPLIYDLPENVIEAWRHCFTEMMNNAIEHSESPHIIVSVQRDALDTAIDIYDDGVGIFQKIHDYMLSEKGEELSLEECMGLLFAGKFTTAKDAHSGEGIFFTSHIMDDFFILSDDLVFTRDNFNERYAAYKSNYLKTYVYMQLSNTSQKTVKDVFDRFTDPDEGFYKTGIPIAHMFAGGSPVSRSEARRLGIMIGKFKEVTLDFAGVKRVGQAFVHELFVVWQRRRPQTQLHVIGANNEVDRMIRRVLTDAENESDE